MLQQAPPPIISSNDDSWLVEGEIWTEIQTNENEHVGRSQLISPTLLMCLVTTNQEKQTNIQPFVYHT